MILIIVYINEQRNTYSELNFIGKILSIILIFLLILFYIFYIFFFYERSIFFYNWNHEVTWMFINLPHIKGQLWQKQLLSIFCVWFCMWTKGKNNNNINNKNYCLILQHKSVNLYSINISYLTYGIQWAARLLKWFYSYLILCAKLNEILIVMELNNIFTDL